jgi:hypothetical protein
VYGRRPDPQPHREPRSRGEETSRRGGHGETGHDDLIKSDAERLAAIKVELDQLWDLLRQREAKRRAGEDPDTAQLRSAGTVEDYLG